MRVNGGLETDVKLLALKVEEGAASKGRPATVVTGDRKDTILP